MKTMCAPLWECSEISSTGRTSKAGAIDTAAASSLRKSGKQCLTSSSAAYLGLGCCASCLTFPRMSAQVTELKVAGMTCGNCARHLTEALRAVPGVEHAAVALETQ